MKSSDFARAESHWATVHEGGVFSLTSYVKLDVSISGGSNERHIATCTFRSMGKARVGKKARKNQLCKKPAADTAKKPSNQTEIKAFRANLIRPDHFISIVLLFS